MPIDSYSVICIVDEATITVTNILNLFEEMAADGLSVEEALGRDIKGFCLNLVDNEGSKSYRNVWRKQLNHNIAKKLGKLGD